MESEEPIINVEEMFDKHEDSHGKWDQIPNAEKRHPVRQMCAFMYIYEQAPADKHRVVGGAEHDLIWLNCDQTKLTEDDVLYLRRCGVWYDSESDSLAMFV